MVVEGRRYAVHTLTHTGGEPRSMLLPRTMVQSVPVELMYEGDVLRYL